MNVDIQSLHDGVTARFLHKLKKCAACPYRTKYGKLGMIGCFLQFRPFEPEQPCALKRDSDP